MRLTMRALSVACSAPLMDSKRRRTSLADNRNDWWRETTAAREPAGPRWAGHPVCLQHKLGWLGRDSGSDRKGLTVTVAL